MTMKSLAIAATLAMPLAIPAMAQTFEPLSRSEALAVAITRMPGIGFPGMVRIIKPSDNLDVALAFALFPAASQAQQRTEWLRRQYLLLQLMGR